MRNPTEILAQAEAVLSELAAVPLTGLTDAVLVATTERTEQVGRLLDGVRVQAAAEIGERSRDELGPNGLAFRHGQKKPATFLEQLTRTSASEARRRLSLGRHVRPRTSFAGEILPPEFPAVAKALTTGSIGVEAAASVTRILDSAARNHAAPEHVTAAEEALVDSAAYLSADLIRTQAEAWRAALDPDGAEPRDAKAFSKRSARAGQECDGLTPLTLMVPSPDLALIQAAWDEAAKFGTKPRFLSEEETTAGTVFIENENGEYEETIRDPRTRTQRQYDVLLGNIRAGLRASETGDNGCRSLASIAVIITAEDFRTGRGVGWIDGINEPVSAGTVKQMADSAGFTPVVLDENGALIATAPRQRFFSTKQRQLIMIRDGHQCVWTNCHAPPGWLDAHHVLDYAKGGLTTIENGVMICPPHHRFLTESGYRMEMFNGTPWLLAPYEVDPTQTWRPLGQNRATMTKAIEPFRF